MDWRAQPDLFAVISALLISLISGFISIAQRIARGQTPSALWVISEFCAALLAGYLMADAYPSIQDELPKWATMPLMIATAAHLGGRFFQMMENRFISQYPVK